MYQPPHKHTSQGIAMPIPELLDHAKAEFIYLESEFNIAKNQRDEFERKLEAQLSEFQTMRQTIIELEVNYQNIKQQYEDKIQSLQSQLKSFQQQQQQPSQLNTSTLSPIPPPSYDKQNSQTHPSISRPSPVDRHSSPAPGRRTPPSINSQQPPNKKQRPNILSNNTPNEEFTFPQVSHTTTTAPNPGNTPNIHSKQQSGSHFPPVISSYSSAEVSGAEVRSLTNPPGQHGPPMPSFDSESNGSPTIPGQLHDMKSSNSSGEVGKTKNSENMLKKEGNDWVVVYNPQVKTNMNINLFHNLDHQSVVCCVRFSHDGKYLATGSNKKAQIFSVDSGQRVRVFPVENKSAKSPSPPPKPISPSSENIDPITMGGEKEDSYIRSVCFSPDAKYLVAGAEDKTVKVWDIKSGQLKQSFVGHELDIYSLDFSSDSKFIVSGSGDGKAKVWNVECGKCEHTLGNDEIGPKEGVTSVAISPDGRVVAAGSLDCVVRLWDIQTGKHQESFKGHDDSVYSVAFSPDGKILASGSLDRTLRLWDLRANPSKCVASLAGHRDYVLSVAFSPDGRWLMSGSKDRSIQFWDPRSNVLHLMLQGHKNSVISVALSPTNNVFASGSGDHRARVWDWSSPI